MDFEGWRLYAMSWSLQNVLLPSNMGFQATIPFLLWQFLLTLQERENSLVVAILQFGGRLLIEGWNLALHLCGCVGPFKGQDDLAIEELQKFLQAPCGVLYTNHVPSFGCLFWFLSWCFVPSSLSLIVSSVVISFALVFPLCMFSVLPNLCNSARHLLPQCFIQQATYTSKEYSLFPWLHAP